MLTKERIAELKTNVEPEGGWFAGWPKKLSRDDVFALLDAAESAIVLRAAVEKVVALCDQDTGRFGVTIPPELAFELGHAISDLGAYEDCEQCNPKRLK